MAAVPPTPTASPCHTVRLRPAGRSRLHVPVITQHMQHTPYPVSDYLSPFPFSKTYAGAGYIVSPCGHTVLDTCEIQKSKGPGWIERLSRTSPRGRRRCYLHVVMQVAGPPQTPSTVLQNPVSGVFCHCKRTPGCIVAFETATAFLSYHIFQLFYHSRCCSMPVSRKKRGADTIRRACMVLTRCGSGEGAPSAAALPPLNPKAVMITRPFHSDLHAPPLRCADCGGPWAVANGTHTHPRMSWMAPVCCSPRRGPRRT